MAKRKRKARHKSVVVPPSKRIRTSCVSTVTHPVLSLYFPRLCTLREYLLERLKPASRRRRQIVQSYGQARDTQNAGDIQKRAIDLLDNVLVGSFPDEPLKWQWKHAEAVQYSQQLDVPSTTCNGSALSLTSQSEIVNFAVWVLFNRIYPSTHKPPHLLCHGFQRTAGVSDRPSSIGSAIPGLTAIFPNEYVEAFKAAEWVEITSLLGLHAEQIMVDMLLNSCIFGPFSMNAFGFYQLSGIPLTDLTVSGRPDKPRRETIGTRPYDDSALECPPRKPFAIRFVRYRMLYGRAALNLKGNVSQGLRHIHVLNRYPDSNDPQHILKVMQYVFPRQFKLHNVFTSVVDHRETAHPFKDYTLREDELSQRDMAIEMSNGNSRRSSHIPRRLRGQTFKLVSELQKRHSKCSYKELLNHYCPPRTGHPDSELAIPTHCVSAFCRACISTLIPHELIDASKKHGPNWELLLGNVDKFVKYRRFETLSLGEVMEGMKIKNMPWLNRPGTSSEQKFSKSEYDKRHELCAELLYYIFDSILVPLIRSNFHVTESSTHRNRLLYFRHDIWRALTQPALSTLKANLFEQMRTERALRVLNNRSLGFTPIRLLPKAHGMRPISNMRRRSTMIRNGRKLLGRSINTVLSPALNIIKYEKSTNPSILGSSLFSVTEIQQALQAYSEHFSKAYQLGTQLFFVKVDIQSCFDNLPQFKVFELANRLMSESEYALSRYAEMRPNEKIFNEEKTGHNLVIKPIRKFQALAKPLGMLDDFSTSIAKYSRHKGTSSVFVDSVVEQNMSRHELQKLLHEHLSLNIVKIGKKFYRQKKGIPQGSVLSTMLCNLLYAEFERERLKQIVQGADSLLLRFIDDFLFITPSRSSAETFLRVMLKGDADYGISVNPSKTLVNFPFSLSDGTTLTNLSQTNMQDAAITTANRELIHEIPYCGMLISAHSNPAKAPFISFAVRKDPSSFPARSVADTLTLDTTSNAGATFQRKMLSALKIQLHALLLDLGWNTLSAVLRNLWQLLSESALRAATYLTELRKVGHPHERDGASLLPDLVRMAAQLARAKVTTASKSSRTRARQNLASIQDTTASTATSSIPSSAGTSARSHYRVRAVCDLVPYVTYAAFHRVFSRRQGDQYRGFADWLHAKLRRHKLKERRHRHAELRKEVWCELRGVMAQTN